MALGLMPPAMGVKHDISTMADLLDRLGVSPERVWLNPLPGTATEEDMLYADDHLDRLCELVDGTLVEKAMGSRESLLASLIISILNAFVLPRRLGFVLAPDGMFRLFTGRVRLPDVAFISVKRLPNGVQQAVLDVSPELAVEILSRTNSPKEMKLKRQEYFDSGVKLVWIVDPELRTVKVYTAPEVFEERGTNGVLDGAEILPGFSVKVSDIFAGLDFRNNESGEV